MQVKKISRAEIWLKCTFKIIKNKINIPLKKKPFQSMYLICELLLHNMIPYLYKLFDFYFFILFLYT